MAIRLSTRSRAIRAASLIAACLIVPAAQGADCSLRDVSGKWSAISTNETDDSSSPYFEVRQTGTSIEGSAAYIVTEDSPIILSADDTRRIDGTLDGTLDSDSIEFTVYWSNNSIGVYTGSIGPQGRMEGTGYDRRNPSTTTAWYSSRSMPCLAVMGSTAPAQAPVRVPEPADPLERKSSAPQGAKPPVPLGRKQVPTGAASTTGSICQAALDARARKSPAADGLERQCLAFETNTFAARGAEIAASDAVVARLRDAQTEGSGRRGFEVGLGAAEMDWELGRQRIRNGLDPIGQQAFSTAVAYSLSRQPAQKPAADEGEEAATAGMNRADSLMATNRISELRQQNDLNDVVEDAALTEIAMAHSRKMVAASQLTHSAPGETPLEERATAGKFTSQLIYASAEGFDVVLKAWDQMPVQRAKLLSPTSTRIGIAAINSITGDTNRLYWTLVIGE